MVPKGLAGAEQGCTDNPIASGNVKAWDDASGTGYISAPDGYDVFVERAALTDGPSLAVGSLVTFEQVWEPIMKRRVVKMCVGASQPGSAPNIGACLANTGATTPVATGWQAIQGTQQRQGAAWANMPDPSDNLYICGLPMNCTEEQLRAIFSAYGGVVSVKVLPDNGKPDRAALVRMSELSQAQWLVENVNQNIPLGLSSPIIVRFAQRSANKISTGETTTGIVKVWLEDRGMGFIVPAAGGDDYFVHRSDLCDGQTLIQGSTITFDPGWDVQKNKPVAKKVSGAVPSPNANLAAAPNAVAASPNPAALVAADVSAGAVAPGMQDGVVKVWFEEKGYGFITPAEGQGDTFVHRSAIQGANSLVQGSPVKFSAQMDPRKGRSVANVCVNVGNTPAPPPPGAPAAAVSTAVATGMRGGVVKVWFEEKGYGFIAADDGSGDIFAHRSSLVDGLTLGVGQRVQYESQWNAIKNKTIAVRVMNAGKAWNAADDGGWSAGAGGGASSPQAAAPSQDVLLSNLPATCTEDSLRATFTPYGAVQEVRMLPDDAQGKVASMRMGTHAQASWLVQNLNGNMPVGFDTPIKVAYAPPEYGKAPAEAGYGKGAAPY